MKGRDLCIVPEAFQFRGANHFMSQGMFLSRRSQGPDNSSGA